MEKPLSTAGQRPTSENEPLVMAIQGSRLEGVEIVGDNGGPILLQFPEGRLEILGPAWLTAGNSESDARLEPSRIALREHIGNAVAAVRVERGRRMELIFDDGRALRASLLPEHRKGGEAAVFYNEEWAFEAY